MSRKPTLPLYNDSRQPRIRLGKDDDSKDSQRSLRSRISYSLSKITPTQLAICVVGFIFILTVELVLTSRTCLQTHSAIATSINGISSVIATNVPEHLQALSHLIIVPGHAIYLPSLQKRSQVTTPALVTESATAMLDASNWILEPYQIETESHLTFLTHISAGVEKARQDPNSLLVFSGGQTRSGLSEASSYYTIAAQTYGILPSKSVDDHTSESMYNRVTTEDFARDSFENLVFSLARFEQVTGHAPEKITIVGFEFKRKRFDLLHRMAIKWPVDKFDYIGIDAPQDAPVSAAQEAAARKGELVNSYKPFQKDLYGCHSPLIDKRIGRDAFRRSHPYFTTSLAGLISHCPSDGLSLYDGPLAWVQ